MVDVGRRLNSPFLRISGDEEEKGPLRNCGENSCDVVDISIFDDQLHYLSHAQSSSVIRIKLTPHFFVFRFIEVSFGIVNLKTINLINKFELP